MKNVIKRDNRLVRFNPGKIQEAIIKAAENNQIDLTINQIHDIIENVIKKIEDVNLDSIAVEQIQDIVVDTINEMGYKKLAVL